MDNIVAQIQAAYLEAFKNKRQAELLVLRSLKSEIKNKEIAKIGQLTNDEVAAALKTEIKKRRDSIESYTAGGRPELAAAEAAEIAIIEKFLPAQLGVEEITAKAREVLAVLPDDQKANFGLVMKAVMSALKGAADGSQVSAVVKSLLA